RPASSRPEPRRAKYLPRNPSPAFSRRQDVRKRVTRQAEAPLFQELDATRWSLFFPDLRPRAPSVGSSSTSTHCLGNFDFSTTTGEGLPVLRGGKLLAHEFH